MEKYGNANFERIYSGKSEIDNEQEYSLPEYLPGISKILKSEARIKTDSKSLQGDNLYINGKVIYDVLYLADFDGRLIGITFSDDFSHSFDLSKYSVSGADESNILLNSYVSSCVTRMHNPRRISSKSRFVMSFDAIEEKKLINENAFDDCKGCDVEFLDRNIRASKIFLCDDNIKSISEEISIDDSMPELDEIVSCDIHLDLMSARLQENTAEADGHICFSCLYKSLDEEALYVALKKDIPVKLDCDIFEDVSGFCGMMSADIASYSCSVSSDNYGENRIISLQANINYGALCFADESILVPTDAYSTDCEIDTDVQRERISSFCGIYDERLNVSERLRCDLRGINSVISSSLNLAVSCPEKYDERLSVGARGTLCVIGMKENGEVDSVQIPVNIHVESQRLKEALQEDVQKYKFINSSSVCAHTCEISGGELVLNADIHALYSVMLEESHEVLCSLIPSAGERKCDSSKISIYYPDSQESVWSVAKRHGVSCKKIKEINNISGDTFEGKRSVILK